MKVNTKIFCIVGITLILATAVAGCVILKGKGKEIENYNPEQTTEEVNEEIKEPDKVDDKIEEKEPESAPTEEPTAIPTEVSAPETEGVAEKVYLTKTEEGIAAYQSLLGQSQKESIQYKAQQIDELLAKLKGTENNYVPEIDGYCDTSIEDINGRSVYVLTDKNGYDRIIIYIHGGSFVTNVTATQLHYADNLANDINAKLYVPIYPLAPTHTYEETYSMLTTLYEEALNEGKSITILGDSAGGGIALGFVEELKEKGIKLPDKLALISPLVDITSTNEETYSYEAGDPLVTRYEIIMCGLAWAGSTDVYDYHVSPIYGDLTGMPKTLVITGTNELLYKDIEKFYNIMEDNKQDIKLVIGDGLFHVFPFYPIPESDEASGILRNFITQ